MNLIVKLFKDGKLGSLQGGGLLGKVVGVADVILVYTQKMKPISLQERGMLC